MRILHTSDWHIGRTFHGERVLDHLGLALDALVTAVREHAVDVVIIAGDVFDSTMPSAEAFDFLDDYLAHIHEAGAAVVMTSGNHDSASRLRFQSRWAKLAGIHIFADAATPAAFVDLDDEFGTVRFTGIPYLEPALIRRHEGAAEVRSQAEAIAWAMRTAEAANAEFTGRSVIVAHCFAAGVPAAAMADDLERDLTAGGLDVVPISHFGDADYVALGHIHGRAELTERIRYSGAPLHYSFGEANSPRGAWLVDLDAAGFAGAQWLALPIPRELRVLSDELAALLTSDDYTDAESAWVAAKLTDPGRPIDAMRRLRERFPHAVHVEYAPRVTTTTASYQARLAAATTPEQRVDAFLEHVRDGRGLQPLEREALGEIMAELHEVEAAR